MSLFETNRFSRTPDTARQEVVYPALFHFRIITEADVYVKEELEAFMAAYKVAAPLAALRVSSAGRYHAYSVSVEMGSLAEMRAFDAAVKRVRGVRMVL